MPRRIVISGIWETNKPILIIVPARREFPDLGAGQGNPGGKYTWIEKMELRVQGDQGQHLQGKASERRELHG